MVEPRSRPIAAAAGAIGWLVLIGVLVVAAVAAVVGGSLTAFSRVSEVGGHSASGRGEAGGRKSKPELDRWIVVHPEDDKARMMLAKVRLSQQRRDARCR